MSEPSMELSENFLSSPLSLDSFVKYMVSGNPSVSNTSPTAKLEKTLSFVISVKDEEATIAELYHRIAEEIEAVHPFEVIFIDDGSIDNSWKVISQLSASQPGHVRGIRFRRNCGKAAALTAGFRAARGEVLFTLDADLQDDPAEIPKFLEKLDEGYDLVSGWKKVRNDPWHKVLPSRIFNRMLSRLGGVCLHDHNCGFKCYRAETIRGLTLHGELHRVIPSLVAMKGYRSTEIEVRHHPRVHGHSKYGIERFLRGFFDIFTIWFMRKFGERPAHFAGIMGLAMLGLGIILIAMSSLIGMLSPGGFVLAVLGVNFVASFPGIFLAGLISELLNRGGLARQWELRICEDTAVRPPTANNSKLDHRTDRATQLPIICSYSNCPENGRAFSQKDL